MDDWKMQRYFGFDPLALLEYWLDQYNEAKITFDARYLTTVDLYIPSIRLGLLEIFVTPKKSEVIPVSIK